MLRFLRIKKEKNKKYRKMIYREKYKYSNDMKERYIGKKKSLLIFGLETSGKTKELNKIYKNRDVIFSDLKKYTTIIMHSTDSLAEIFFNNIEDDDIEKYLLSLSESKQNEAEKNINKQFIKIEILKFKAKNSLLFVDDIDKFSGKKLEILKSLIRDCKRIYATAQSDKTIHKTIYKIIENKDFISINLKSSNSFDVTNYALIALMIPFALTGQYAIVMMLLLANRYLDKGVGK
jgi:hypothetical protein